MEEKANPGDYMCWPRFELYTDPVPEWNEVRPKEIIEM